MYLLRTVKIAIHAEHRATKNRITRGITRIHVNAPFVELVKTNKNARSVSMNINEISRR